MGLFSKKPKPNPVIETQDLRIEFNASYEQWRFHYGGVEFYSFGSTFSLPTLEQLDRMLSDIEHLKPEMIRRVVDGWKNSLEITPDDGKEFSVSLTDFASIGSFEVSWTNERVWADMGIDFTIKNHSIIEENWGD